MKNKKVIIVAIIISVIILTFICYKVYKGKDNYSYEWVEVKDSSIGQYMLYVNNSIGNHIDGTIKITYLNGASETIDVPKEGILYVKDTIVNVSNPKKKWGKIYEQVF